MLTIGDFARLGQVSPRTLRHYDDLGLLRPERVDPATGYRFYRVVQLARLHRLLAFRDLGFSLDQVGGLLDDDLSLDELHGMLRMRRAQIEQGVAEEQARLRRVEARLRALQGDPTVADIVLKTTETMRVAEAADTAPGFGSEKLGPVFARLYPEVIVHLSNVGARPGLCVAWYDEPAEDGTVVVHAGFAIDDQSVESGPRVRVVELPAIEVAAVVHRGSMDTVVPVYEALAQWVEDSGYRMSGRSRELYHEWHPNDPTENVTELQLPVTT